MDFDEYQKKSIATAIYPKVLLGDSVCGWVYPGLKLAGEAGEVSEKLGKVLRDNNGVPPEGFAEDVKKELGDVLWYVAAIAHEFDIDLNDVAEANVAKLADRKKREVLGGSGDNR